MAEPSVDLEELWKSRQGLEEFKMRDQAYRLFEATFLGRSLDRKEQYLTWRPQVIDGGYTGDSAKDRQLINLSRQIVNHHQASFSRPPRVWNVPYTAETQADADKKSALLQGVFRFSRIKSVQPLLSWRLSARGDGVLGVEWQKGGHGQSCIMVRSFDPAMCYPDLDSEDIGRCRDMLITYEVRKEWAETTFNVHLSGRKPTARMFVYWTDQCRYLQVDDQMINMPEYTFEHKQGFVPFRWIFNTPNGHMAQADIAEIPKMQELLSDTFLLAMDATRKRVDKAYWGRGISGDVTPEPGKVKSFPNPQAEIHEFPTADPPAILQGTMQMIQQFAQAMGGISPISMEGMAGGSIVTGTAVRHQVEAIEARTETKRVSLEHGYAILGEYVLRVLEKQFPEEELVFQTGSGEVSMKGLEVNNWWTCEASYGGFEGMDPMMRGRWALEGMGRLHDDRKAIAIAYPDEDTDAMVRRLEDYQIRQAMAVARAQAAAAQAGGQSAPQGQPGPGGTPGAPGGPAGPGQVPAPQKMSPPEPPGLGSAARAAGGNLVELGELESLINVVRDRLHGNVWAVGEMALAGKSATPRVLVEKKDDQGVVMIAFESKGAKVTVGTPGKQEPAVSLLQ